AMATYSRTRTTRRQWTQLQGAFLLNDEREEPRRLLNRREAVRRLIHAAVRMFAIGEDPFAVHLLIQSADKLLIDIAKKRAVDLAVDWENLIKEEHRSEFFAMYRETYNFF